MTQQVLEPLQNCIEAEGLNYNGIIYVGAMLSEGSIKVLEFNIRLGDPEAEVILPRITSDFVATCEAILHKRLGSSRLEISDDFCCNVVATQGKTKQISADGKNKGWYKGWPYGRYGKGYKISGLETIDTAQCKVFIGEAADHPEKGLMSDGGRVIHVVGIGKSKAEAIEFAYGNIDKVVFEGMRYRSDIGQIYNDTRLMSEAEIVQELEGKKMPPAANYNLPPQSKKLMP